MWLRSVISGAAAVAFAASSALASVTVSSSVTGVSLETRMGRVAVAVGSEVNNGVRIHVGSAVGGSGGDTTLRFDNGCEVTLRPGQIYTVPAAPPCISSAVPPGGVGASVVDIAPAAIGAGFVGIGAAVAVSAGSKGSAGVPYISR